MPLIRISNQFAVNPHQISHVEYLGGGRLGVFVCGREHSMKVDNEIIPATCEALGIDTPDKGEPDNKARSGSGIFP